MSRIKYVYVAGPYRKPDPVENTHNAVRVADQISDMGFVPFIPHAATLLWHIVVPHVEQYWLDYDNEWLAKCDALLRIPGESSGSDEEERLARSLGIPVCYSVEELLELRTFRERAA